MNPSEMLYTEAESEELRSAINRSRFIASLPLNTSSINTQSPVDLSVRFADFVSSIAMMACYFGQMRDEAQRELDTKRPTRKYSIQPADLALQVTKMMLDGYMEAPIHNDDEGLFKFALRVTTGLEAHLDAAGPLSEQLRLLQVTTMLTSACWNQLDVLAYPRLSSASTPDHCMMILSEVQDFMRQHDLRDNEFFARGITLQSLLSTNNYWLDDGEGAVNVSNDVFHAAVVTLVNKESLDHKTLMKEYVEQFPATTFADFFDFERLAQKNPAAVSSFTGDPQRLVTLAASNSRLKREGAH